LKTSKTPSSLLGTRIWTPARFNLPESAWEAKLPLIRC
jgi:hypothetical protein